MENGKRRKEKMKGMIANMKKSRIALTLTLLGVTLFLLRYLARPSFLPQTELLIDRTESKIIPPISLHFRDMRDYSITTFDPINPSHLSDSYIQFTEGFIDSNLLNHYYSIIENTATDTPSVGLLYQVYETDDMITLVYCDVNTSIYVFDKSTDNYHLITLPDTLYLHTLHLIEDTFIGVGNVSNSLEEIVFSYSLYSEDFIHYTPRPISRSIRPYEREILDEHTILMITDEALVTYHLDEMTSTTLSTLEHPSRILREDNRLALVSTLETTFTLALLDQDLGLLDPTAYSYPTATALPIDFLLQEDYLYVRFNDPYYSRFEYYINIYSLVDSRLIYSLGIECLDNFTMLGMSIGL